MSALHEVPNRRPAWRPGQDLDAPTAKGTGKGLDLVDLIGDTEAGGR